MADQIQDEIQDEIQKNKILIYGKGTKSATLPKVYINGTFYGDTDILGPMEQKGELQPLLKEAFKTE